MNTNITQSGCRCAGNCAVGRKLHSNNQAIIHTESQQGFFEAAMDSPRSIIILKQDKPLERDGVRRLALVLGGVQDTRAFGDVRTIAYDPAATKSTALSLREHKMHIDGSFMPEPPARFILSFYQSDPNGGGVSLFAPVAQILSEAPEWALKALYTAEFKFARDDDDGFTDSYVGTILSRDPNGNPRLRWRYDENVRPQVVDAKETDAQGAVNWVADFLENQQPIRYAAASGETILVPNRSMLHGRTKLSDNSPRTVFRAWVA